ncbi:spermidine/putrescine transport system substrate-binding protein [Rhodobium orientis]|uniref:ABC transporter substrate-binding protein n=1 Tax=Rhodobium orientis TaxID=34017 RepID=A0A327JRL8_9HYPH|nr:spermidine/putrescine ABC transporter substrate-binding protein [Rhodobium orientis]MBB4301729.1 spermidine/putrescine transport system substrate-binding protein [Rhodobium orientis]MBK5950532.1 ABC transporter substrate-binding protein [Rhodobium orientis]RAI28176.1 ABC transporter substrate-binding protein [Rhodobium orientis]
MNTAIKRLKLTGAVALSSLLAGVAAMPAANATEELNALVWCDHTDPALIEPFEKKFDVKVNLKEYEGTGSALAIVEQSQPGDWDVFVIDGVDVPRAIDADLLAPLPADELPLDDIFPELRLESSLMRDGKLYAVSEKFGYNTVSFNKTKVDAADMKDMTVLWSDAYKGRIAVYDYYLPVIGMVAVGLGKKTSELTADDLPEIKETLFKIKDNAKLVGEVVSSQTAIATGEVDILVGGGEWVTAGLSADKPELDWILPDQGGVRWSQSIGVFKDSKRKELATEFVKYIVSPEGQARLATSSCYWAMPANAKAGAELTDQQKAALRWDDQEAYLKNAQMYPAPDAELDAAMQDLWTEFLQH